MKKSKADLLKQLTKQLAVGVPVIALSGFLPGTGSMFVSDAAAEGYSHSESYKAKAEAEAKSEAEAEAKSEAEAEAKGEAEAKAEAESNYKY